jgi:hypothetical protein
VTGAGVGSGARRGRGFATARDGGEGLSWQRVTGTGTGHGSQAAITGEEQRLDSGNLLRPTVKCQRHKFRRRNHR